MRDRLLRARYRRGGTNCAFDCEMLTGEVIVLRVIGVIRLSASAIRCVGVWGALAPQLPEKREQPPQQQQPQRQPEIKHHPNPRPPLTLQRTTQLLLLTLNL